MTPSWPTVVEKAIFRIGNGLALIKFVIIVVAARCKAHEFRVDLNGHWNGPVVIPGSGSYELVLASLVPFPFCGHRFLPVYSGAPGYIRSARCSWPWRMSRRPFRGVFQWRLRPLHPDAVSEFRFIPPCSPVPAKAVPVGEAGVLSEFIRRGRFGNPCSSNPLRQSLVSTILPMRGSAVG
jgi:hypothetical protein